MLRTAVEERLRDERARDGYLFPAYDDYCFGSVPDTIRSILDADASRTLPDDVFEGVRTDVTNVVTVVVDGYGLDSWKRDRHDHAFLNRLTDRGTVTPLTSIYPSETAAAMTTFETGQLPCEHGRIGWNVYEPETDRSFVALTGETKHGDDEFAEESTDGVDYHYEDLATAGVDCHRVQPLRRETDGVTHHHYEELASFGERLARVVERSDDPAYVYGYVPDVDHVSHAEGTDSAAFRETVASVCAQLESFVAHLNDETAAETLLLVTADHGHANTDPERNVDLSDRTAVVESLRTHADGTPVKLAGSPRNVHLHLRDGSVGAVQESLSDLDARLFTRSAALDRDLFGDRAVSNRFRRRCGDLVLTHRDLGTWWGDVEPDELELIGMHGGLHPSEMLVPFAAVRADRL
jgi:predicted AlkP superfamily pyrophosphatase or phosphodiesterase